jgi:hypothetical protein
MSTCSMNCRNTSNVAGVMKVAATARMQEILSVCTLMASLVIRGSLITFLIALFLLLWSIRLTFRRQLEVKPSLYAPYMQTGIAEVELHSFGTSVVDVSDHAHAPASLTPGKVPSTY